MSTETENDTQLVTATEAAVLIAGGALLSANWRALAHRRHPC